MKLSAEQAQLAYTILQTKGRPTVDSPLTSHASAVSADLVTRVMARIANTPDPSPARVADALDVLRGCLPSPAAVAERIIWRAYADSIR
jgi:hypothetical protein